MTKPLVVPVRLEMRAETAVLIDATNRVIATAPGHTSPLFSGWVDKTAFITETINGEEGEPYYTALPLIVHSNQSRIWIEDADRCEFLSLGVWFGDLDKNAQILSDMRFIADTFNNSYYTVDENTGEGC